MKWLQAITGATLILLMILLLIMGTLSIMADRSSVYAYLQLAFAILFGIYGAHLFKMSGTKN